MSLVEASVWLAVGSGALAYVLPLILRARMRSEFPRQVLVVPALSLASWLAAEYAAIGPARVGFTFLGAIPVAATSNLVVLALVRVRSAIRRHSIPWTVGIVVFSVLTGVGLRMFLPALPD